MSACGSLLMVGIASAEDISGTISSTLTISENSELVRDVASIVANAPGLSFGADHIKRV